MSATRPSVVLVYDSSCGECGEIAGRVGTLLSRPVTTRSCRDPHLATEFGELRGQVAGKPCRRPILLLRAADGTMRPLTGLPMYWHAARLAPVARWPGGAALLIRILALRIAHRNRKR